MDPLEDVAQPSTQWSVVYWVSFGEFWVVMGESTTQVHKIETLDDVLTITRIAN